MGCTRSWRKKRGLRSQADAETSGPITRLGAVPNPGPIQAPQDDGTSNTRQAKSTENRQRDSSSSLLSPYFEGTINDIHRDATMILDALVQSRLPPERAQELIDLAVEKAHHYGSLPDGRGGYEFAAVMRVILGAAKLEVEDRKLGLAEGYKHGPVSHQHLHVHQQGAPDSPSKALSSQAYLDGASASDLAKTARMLTDYGVLDVTSNPPSE